MAANMPATVYFDLETQRSFNDVGGASNLSKMGVSVGCSFCTDSGIYRVYPEEELEELRSWCDEGEGKLVHMCAH